MSSASENKYIPHPIEVSVKPVQKGIENDDCSREKIKELAGDGSAGKKKAENNIPVRSRYCPAKLVYRLAFDYGVKPLLLIVVSISFVVGFLVLHNKVSNLEKTVERLNNSNIPPTREVVIVEKYFTNESESVIVRMSNISSDSWDSLNATVLAQGGSIKAQGEAILSMQGFLTDLGIAHNSTTSSVERLKQEIKYNNSLLTSQWNETVQQLDNLSALVDMFSQSHSDHQLQINGIQNNVSAIESKQAQMDNQLTSLESGHQSQSQEISSLQSNTSQLTNQLTDTKREVTNNQEKTSEIDKRLSSLQSDMTQSQEDRRDIKLRLSKLESSHSGTYYASPFHSLYLVILTFCCRCCFCDIRY